VRKRGDFFGGFSLNPESPGDIFDFLSFRGEPQNKQTKNPKNRFENGFLGVGYTTQAWSVGLTVY
jgi:hypothetical protein